MKFLLALLVFVFAHVSCAQNQTGADILQLAIKELPPCAVSKGYRNSGSKSDHYMPS